MAIARWFLMGKILPPAASTGLFATAGTVVLLLFACRCHVPGWLRTDAFLVPLYGAILLGGSRTTGLVERHFSARVLMQLGDASYALYILHVPLAFWWGKAERMTGREPLASWPSLLAFWLFAIAASYATFIGIERPIRRRILQWPGNRG